jgi:hypothetical protein
MDFLRAFSDGNHLLLHPRSAWAPRPIRQLLAAFYSDAVAAAILVFVSRNIFSTAIRTFLAV